METSAKETINIDELFIDTAKVYLEKQSNLNKKDAKNIKQGNIDINNTNQEDEGNNNSKCC